MKKFTPPESKFARAFTSSRKLELVFAFLCASFIFFAGDQAHAGAAITYQGRIVKPDGVTPVQDMAVQFRIQIKTPDATDCVLYQETRTLDMRNSLGSFSMAVGDGSVARQDISGLSMSELFSNRVPLTLPAGACTGSNVFTAATATDGRAFSVSFNDGSFAGWEPLPAMSITYAPLAVESTQVAGFPATSLLRFQKADGTLVNTSPLSDTEYTELTNLIAGTSSQYAKTSAAAGQKLPVVAGAPATPVAGSVWYNSTAGSVQFYDGTSTKTVGVGGGSVTSIATGTGLTGGPITSTGTISLEVLGTAGTAVKPTYDVYGRVTGSSSLVEADIPTLSTAGKVSGSAINAGTIGGSASVSTTGDVTAANVSSTTSLSKTYQFFNTAGTHKVSIIAPTLLAGDYSLTLPSAVAGSNGQVLTSDTSGNLTWTSPTTGSVTSVTGTAPVISSGGATPAISMHVADSTHDGYLAQGDWSTFNGKIGTIVGSLLNSAKIWVGDGTNKAAEVAISGDVSMTNSGATKVTALQNFAVDTTTPLDGQVLKYVGAATNKWQPANYGIMDLKTSIGSAQFSNASCAASQTITWSAITDAFTCSNIASLDAAAITTGTIAAASLPLTAYVNGGNAFTADATMGNTGNFGLSLLTNNSPRITILNNGNVGVGISPTAALQLKAGTATASTAPLKFTSAGSALLTTPEDGAMEYDGANYYLTVGASRKSVALSGGVGSFTSETVGVGTSGTPSLNFTGDTTTGLYQGGAGVIGFSSAGSNIGTWSATGLTIAGAETFSSGTGAVSLNGTTTVAAGKNLTLASGTGQFAQTYSGTGPAAAITDTAAASGNILNLVSTSTAAATGDAGLSIAISGANATNAVTRYGQYTNVTATNAVSGTNIGGYFSASGATTANYGLLVGSGAVGIGTTTPVAPLEVSGASSSGVNESVRISGAALPRMYFNGDGTGFLTGNAGIQFNGGNNYYFGIGSNLASPAITIQANNAVFIPNIQFGYIGPIGGATADTFGRLEGNKGAIYFGTDAEDMVKIYNQAPHNFADTIRVVSAGAGIPNLVVQGIAAQTGDLQRWVDSNNNPLSVVTSAGNIGIGSATPTAVLNLKAGTATASTAPLKFTSGTVLTTPEDGAVEYDGSHLYIDIGATRYQVAVNGAAQTFSGNQTFSGVLAVTNTTASTTPTTGAEKIAGGLGVAGDIFSGATINAATSLMAPQIYGSTANSGTIKIDGTSAATKGHVLLNSAGGYVGIGTTSPTAALQVDGSGAGIASVFRSASNGSFMQFQKPDTTVIGEVSQQGAGPITTLILDGGTQASGSGMFYYDGPDRSNSAYVAFGIDNAAGFFGKSGAVLSSSKNGTGVRKPLYIGGYSGGWTSAITVQTNADVGINTETDAGYNLDVNGTFRNTTSAYLATSSGSVGIGTTTADTKLHVVGTSGTTLKIVDGNQGAGKVLTSDTAGVASWAAVGAATALPFNGLTAAAATNTIDNTNYAQAWNWSTATTQNLISSAANALTTGSILNLTTSNASVNSTNGLLYVANTSAGTSGTVARIQSNSTAGSGLTVLANGNVGIGTATPTDRLEINGNITNGGGVTVSGSGNAKYRIGTLGAAVPNWGGQFMNAKFNEGAGNWTADDATLVSGFFKLDVRNIANGNEIAFYRMPVAANPRSDATWTPIAEFKLDTGNVLLAPSSGNVGIGTTTVDTKLHVVGSSGATLKIVDGNQGAGKVLTSDAAGVASWAAAGAATAVPFNGLTAAAATNTIDNTNFAQAWNWSTATTQNLISAAANALTTGSILNLTTSNASVNSTNGLLYVANTSAGTSGTVARIQSNSTAGSGLTVLANGKVGIGTATPVVPLDVAGYTSTTNTAQFGGFGIQSFGLNNGFLEDNSYWDGSNMIYRATGTLAMFQFASGDIMFRSSPSGTAGTAATLTTNMIVKNTGNVGIGTTTVDTKLHIVGSSGTTLKIVDGNQGAGKVLTSDAAGVASWAAAGAATAVPFNGLTAAAATNTIDNTNYAQAWNWSTATTQNLISAAANALTTGSILNLTTSNASVNSTNGLLYVANTSAGTSGTVARIQSNSTAGSGLTVLANGTVGIGTAAPGYPLDISHSGYFAFHAQTTSSTGQTAFYFENDHGSYGSYGGLLYGSSGSSLGNLFGQPRAERLFLFSDGASNQGFFTGTLGAQPYAIGTNNAERMRITSAGAVGIGTDTPNAQLQVNGTITGKASVLNGTTTIDFSTGNQQYTAGSCGAYTLYNIKDGGTYSFVLKGATSGTCVFTAYSDAGSTALTVHYPPGHGATTAGKHTLYNFMSMGTDLYVAYVPGY